VTAVGRPVTRTATQFSSSSSGSTHSDVGPARLRRSMPIHCRHEHPGLAESLCVANCSNRKCLASAAQCYEPQYSLVSNNVSTDDALSTAQTADVSPTRGSATRRRYTIIATQNPTLNSDSKNIYSKLVLSGQQPRLWFFEDLSAAAVKSTWRLPSSTICGSKTIPIFFPRQSAAKILAEKKHD